MRKWMYLPIALVVTVTTYWFVQQFILWLTDVIH